MEGTPASPKTDLSSQLFQWRDGQLELVEEFPTFGGTDASYFHVDGEDYLAVSNSLTPAVRFRQDMVIYKLTRSEEHTSELQSLMRISYAVFCLKKKTKHK